MDTLEMLSKFRLPSVIHLSCTPILHNFPHARITLAKQLCYHDEYEQLYKYAVGAVN